MSKLEKALDFIVEYGATIIIAILTMNSVAEAYINPTVDNKIMAASMAVATYTIIMFHVTAYNFSRVREDVVNIRKELVNTREELYTLSKRIKKNDDKE